MRSAHCPQTVRPALLRLLLLAVLLALTVNAYTPNNTNELIRVHVLEKCCPFATRFDIGDYVQPQEGDIEWRLALSFQAFKFNRAALSGRKCWKISDIVVSASQGLRQLGALAVPEPEDLERVFCVDNVQPPVNDEDLKNLLYYGENEVGSVAIVEVGATPDAMQKRGWLHEKTPHFQFRPVALHSWILAKPLPLITQVSVNSRERTSSWRIHDPCRVGKIGGGNYNGGFVDDPAVHLCVEYTEFEALSSHNVIADDGSEKMYVSGLHMQEFEYKVKNPKCPEGMQAMSNSRHAWYASSTMPFKFPGYATTYFIMCLTKSRVVTDDGKRIADITFLSRIFVDELKDRPLRIRFEANDAIDWLPYGDSKDARVVNSIFD